MKKILSVIFAASLLFAASCKDSDILMPNVSGAAFEVLLVIDNDIYRTPAGETVFNILNGDVPKLPQSEPQFDISRIQYAHFDQLFRTTRSIVFVVVDSTKYTKTTINLISDRWAKTQTVVNITAANVEDLDNDLKANADKILDYLIAGERKRQMAYIKENIGQEALERAYMMFGCKVAVPLSMNKFKEGEHFLWISNGSSRIRQDFVIYSVPYTSLEQLEDEALFALRDSVMKANVQGSTKGSYMGTEYKYEPPIKRTINKDKMWVAEIRGLWKMMEGAPMGGPFVQHVHIDELNGRILVAEGFVFAPGEDKRNALRQMEAMLYSIKLPHQENAVVVTPNNKNTDKK